MIKINISVILIILFGSSAGITSAQQYQDGNLVQYWDMPISAWNVDTYIWPAAVSEKNFFAQQFWFENNPNGDDGAYIGIQQLADSSTRIARFSIWNSTAASGSNCRDFGGEGIGKTCEIAYDFKTQQWHKLRIWRLNADDVGQWWGGWVIDANGNESHIGNIRAPFAVGDILATASFNEYFGAADNCGSLPSSYVFFYRPSLNNGHTIASMAGTSIGRCAAGEVVPYWNNTLSRLHLNSNPD